MILGVFSETFIYNIVLKSFTMSYYLGLNKKMTENHNNNNLTENHNNNNRIMLDITTCEPLAEKVFPGIGVIEIKKIAMAGVIDKFCELRLKKQYIEKKWNLKKAGNSSKR